MIPNFSSYSTYKFCFIVTTVARGMGYCHLYHHIHVRVQTCLNLQGYTVYLSNVDTLFIFRPLHILIIYLIPIWLPCMFNLEYIKAHISCCSFIFHQCILKNYSLYFVHQLRIIKIGFNV